MARRCTACDVANRAELDAAILARVPYAQISRDHGISRDSVRRHLDGGHVRRAIAVAEAGSATPTEPLTEAPKAPRVDDLPAQVRALQGKAVAALLRAEKNGDERTVLGAIREARACVELLAKLIGQLDERPVQNVLVTSPEWVRVRTVLMSALAPYPDARVAVAAALQALQEP